MGAGLIATSEVVLLRALEEMTGEICRVVTRVVWVHGVQVGLDPLVPVATGTTLSAHITSVIDDWRVKLQKLTSWLDWSVWVERNLECGIEEMCYLPTSADLACFLNRESLNDAWKRPQPRYIRRFAPYSTKPRSSRGARTSHLIKAVRLEHYSSSMRSHDHLY
ncbi:hypothetical protein B0H16DRAFT_121040 [Mycena metata]|uniref:Uncharacterized protein n=1 Tax=Mycena metata TaxID=1033252 RepID=A0AAD7MXE7_9AGAR|nr:hypothetical protein B0H16DRAFT_121040 [Mycena metata]